MAEKLGFMATANRVGIRNFVLDPRNISHDDEITRSESLTVCIRGSKQFFTNNSRSNLLIDRLNNGKSITVVCHKNKIPDIQEIREDFEKSGAKIDKFFIKYHEINLMYNFIEADEGIWIKTYFVNRHDLLYAAPAFFVAANTDLWNRYKRDISEMDFRTLQ